MARYRYLNLCLATLVLGATLVAGINVVVDPYGLFGIVEIAGFNAEKPTRDGSRSLKSLQLRRQNYDVVVLGSSRAQLGIDPASPTLEGARAFNLGLVDVSMTELEHVVDYMLRHQAPHTVLIGVDLISFNANRPANGDFAESGFAGNGLIALYVPRVLSSRAFTDSVSTVAYNLSGAGRARFGRHGALERPADTRYDHRAAFRHMIGFYAKWDFYTDFIYSAASVRALRRALERLLARDIRVFLFISPVHASQLEVMRLMGLYDDFERAKRDLVALTVALDAGERLQLWDFSGYNSITLEHLPAPHSGDAMHWYWEQAHYRRSTGDLMLARMLGTPGWAERVPADFGVRLGPGNIDGHLAALRAGQRRYRDSGHAAQAIIEEVFADRFRRPANGRVRP